MSVEDQPHCGHPSTSRTDKNVAELPQAVRADYCRTNDETSDITGVSWSPCQCILTGDMTMKRVAA
jgi:hypothetical protein